MSQTNPPKPPTPPPASTPTHTPGLKSPLGPPTPTTRKVYERQPTGPKRVRDGLKLKTIKDGEPKSLISRRWIDLIMKMVDHEEITQGLEYARVGQIIKLDIKRGELIADVQGTKGRPYRTQIRLVRLDEAHWRELIEQMAKEAIYSARLLSAELSDELHDAFEAVEIELVPPSHEMIEVECSCLRDGVCRHVAAVSYLLADRLEKDPALIFTLRGMPFEELLEHLRHERQIHTRGLATTHADPMIPETQKMILPLDECLEDFWRVGRELDESVQAPLEPHLPHALLRRLGPTPLEGTFPMVGLMASIYDTVSKYANDLRDRAEGIDTTSEVDDEAGAEENGDSEQLT